MAEPIGSNPTCVVMNPLVRGGEAFLLAVGFIVAHPKGGPSGVCPFSTRPRYDPLRDQWPRRILATPMGFRGVGVDVPYPIRQDLI